LPNWLEADFWAVARILDRALGGFIRGQVLIAFVVGGLTFLGLRLLERLGWPDMRYEVLLAIFAGLLQLIPTFGVVLNLGLGTLAGLSHSSEMALAVLLVYLAVHWLVGAFITPRLTRRVVAIHPAVLVLVLVALGQLGIFWVLLAAPVAAIARDLFRYAYGRFGEPARPPGLLPSGPVLPLPDPLPATATETAAARRVPLAYRQRALRRTGGGS
jgi:predicted PurR-regulated permease PerM